MVLKDNINLRLPSLPEGFASLNRSTRENEVAWLLNGSQNSESELEIVDY
jgi:hypothetical protein